MVVSWWEIDSCYKQLVSAFFSLNLQLSGMTEWRFILHSVQKFIDFVILTFNANHFCIINFTTAQNCPVARRTEDLWVVRFFNRSAVLSDLSGKEFIEGFEISNFSPHFMQFYSIVFGKSAINVFSNCCRYIDFHQIVESPGTQTSSQEAEFVFLIGFVEVIDGLRE